MNKPLDSYVMILALWANTTYWSLFHIRRVNPWGICEDSQDLGNGFKRICRVFLRICETLEMDS